MINNLQKKVEKTKICLITAYYPPDMGAGSIQAWNLGKGLSQRGNSVTIITAFPHYPYGKIPRKYIGHFIIREIEDEIKIVRTWVPSLASDNSIHRVLLLLSFSISYFMALLLSNSDVIYVVGPWVPSPFTLPAYIYSKIKDVPLILHEADSVPDILFGMNIISNKFTKKLLRVIGNAIERHSASIVTYTESIRKMICSRGISQKKVFLIPLPVDIDVFKPMPKSNLSKRLELEGKFVIMYSGIMSQTYDFDTLLKTAKILKEYNKISFIIRGDGELKNWIIKKVQDENIKNVIIMGKVEKIKSVAEILSIADAFVVPMAYWPIWTETVIPTKVNEYLACGKPVLSSTIGETFNLIESQIIGIAVPVGRADLLAKAITTLYSDENLRNEMGLRARNFAIKYFDYKEIGRKLEEVLFLSAANRL